MTGLPPAPDRVIALSTGVLDHLMPMHLWFDDGGRVVQTGPTLAKMLARGDLAGVPVADLIEIRRPARARTAADLVALAGQRLSLTLRNASDLPLRGTIAVWPGQAGAILDISLGLSFAGAVAAFDLTLADFSPCDQTVELMYLYEANASTAALSRHLSERLEAARAAAETQALTDALSGLANRRAMDLEIGRRLADLSEDFALLHIDLDLFKQVNDTMGHAAGDHVITHVGAVLRAETRASDMAARVGGDEFLLLLSGPVDRDGLARLGARLIARLEEPILFEGKPCLISASIGAVSSAGYPRRPDIDGLLADTDLALYTAKRTGRGRVVLHGDDTPPPRGRRASDPTARAP